MSKKQIMVLTVYHKGRMNTLGNCHSVRIFLDGEPIQEYEEGNCQAKAEGFIDALKLTGKGKYLFVYTATELEEVEDTLI